MLLADGRTRLSGMYVRLQLLLNAIVTFWPTDPHLGVGIGLQATKLPLSWNAAQGISGKTQ